MSEKIIEKNLALSADFNGYLVKHPSFTARLPNNACLIFEDKSDSYLTSINRKLGRDIANDGEICFKAIKDGKSWEIERIKS